MNLSPTKEVIFIGFPSLTHHYGGLSADNVASSKNRGAQSNPQLAALQAIELMRHLLQNGQIVGVMPPHLRPHLPLLAERGFTMETAPIELLEKASSSSAMWVANAATITPCVDTADGFLHITTANLHTNEHRRIEAETTHKNLARIFANVPNVAMHPPLDAAQGFRDEGAANHMRLSPRHSDIGLHIFSYGGRQTLSASQQIAKQHQLKPEQVLFVEQNAKAIEAGVFHNDVIAISHLNLLLVHECAYAGGMADIKSIETAYSALHKNDKLKTIIIRESELSLEEVVNSYFFNSQIISLANGEMMVIAPEEIETLYKGKAAKLMRNYFANVKELDLRQSMRNGGGPACLRLRVQMTEEQISAMRENGNGLVDEAKLENLEALAKKYYPTELVAEGLRNPELHTKCKEFLASFYN